MSIAPMAELQQLRVAAARDDHRPVAGGGLVVEAALVHPSRTLVERAGPRIAGDDCQPCLRVAVLSHPALGLADERLRDTGPAEDVSFSYVQLTFTF